MKCPKCQHENPDEANFCNKCAFCLKRVREIFSNADIVPKSYTPKFLADKILSSKAVIEGERKFVTVLFADVANFTDISEKLDPEEIHRIMDGCFRVLMDSIHKYEGTINQFTGDGIMALFGAPIAHEDHAQRACQAALSIQKAMGAFGAKIKNQFKVDFALRVGLNSGPVIVGSIGDDLRMDYTAIGDTTNLAARMEGIAKPGTVMVSKNTHYRAYQQFEFTPLGKTTIKGKAAPQEVYQLDSKISKPTLDSNRMIRSEIVGRQQELNRLELHVLKAKNGEGSVVNIIGEAGIGKSRLVAELKHRETLKGVMVLEGRALSMGRNLRFYPIVEALKIWANIEEDDSEFDAANKLESAIKNIHPRQAEEIFPFIGIIMGISLSGKYLERIKGIEGEALEKLIFKNLRALIIKIAELMPLVLIVEDMHWADESSIDLLAALFKLLTRWKNTCLFHSIML